MYNKGRNNMPKNLFSSNKFKFNLTGERFRNNELDITITGMNIPGISLGTIPLNTSIRTIERPGDSIVFSDINIEYIVTENFTEWIVLYDWLNALRDFNKNSFDNSIMSDGKLILLTNKSNPNLLITFTDMFIADLGDIDLTLNVADGEVVKGTATFKFNSMEVSTDI